VQALFSRLQAEISRLQESYGDDGRFSDPATWPPGNVHGDFAGKVPLGTKTVAEALASASHPLVASP